MAKGGGLVTLKFQNDLEWLKTGVLRLYLFFKR